MTDVTMLNVSSVAPSSVPAGKLLVLCTTKASKDKDTGKVVEVPEEHKRRCVLIDEFTPAVPSKFVALVTSALGELAKARLAGYWKENDPREVPAASFTEDALLLYAAQEAESKRLTGDTILSWWNEGDGAKLKQQLIASEHGEKGAGKVIERIRSISAPYPKFDIARCDQYVVMISEACDPEDEFTERLLKKIAAHKEKLVKEAADNDAL